MLVGTTVKTLKGKTLKGGRVISGCLPLLENLVVDELWMKYHDRFAKYMQIMTVRGQCLVILKKITQRFLRVLGTGVRGLPYRLIQRRLRL